MIDGTKVTRATGWEAVLPSSMAAAAAAVAREVAGRLGDRERVRACAASAKRQTAFPESMRWVPYALAQGDAGLALLCGHLDACFPGQDWDVAGHGYMMSAARGAEQAGYLPAGLFGGLGGMAFVAWSLSCSGARYSRLLAELDRVVVPEVTRRGHSLYDATSGVSVSVFDVISGIAGTGAYLLSRREDPAAAEALKVVLAGLVALCGERDGLPNWHTPIQAMAGNETMALQFPYGNLNCGLAHGIPGPLALMSLALRAGVAVEGQHDAVQRTAGWLAEHRADDAWGVNWPSAVAVPSNAGSSPPSTPSRSAWCYGSPGVARALWFAGVALQDAGLRALAVEAMAATYRRPRQQRCIDSPTFCHGIAGLLQITLRFANDTRDPVFARAAMELTEQLLGLYAPEHPLGYYSLEPGGNRVDQPGLLDGAPGVSLALLAASTDVPPTWDRIFLLS
jgi:hypothetical protein